MNESSVLSMFIDASRSAFAFLEHDYGFHVTETRVVGYAAWIIYETQATQITAYYEQGAEPVLELGPLVLHKGRMVAPETVTLDHILHERGRPLDYSQGKTSRLDEASISQMVSVRADRLRTYCDDLLKGDFRTFPNLLREAEKELHRREKELFGSEQEG